MVKDSKSGGKETSFIDKVQKRDGSIVSFDLGRITNAINKAMISVEEGSEEEAKLVANKVLADLVRIVKNSRISCRPLKEYRIRLKRSLY